MCFTTFDDADIIVSRFIDLLSKRGITPAIGSKIEGEFLSPFQLLESTRNVGALSDTPELFADAGGMYDLAAKLLAVETQPEFDSFIPHLKLFEANAEFSTAVQSNLGDIRDDVNRKLAELYLGSLAIHFAFDIKLDDPKNSKGDNPDVMFEVRPGDGQSPSLWAFAVKTLSTQSGQTIFEKIKEAAGQIDSSACHANRGMVVINLKNAVQHKQLWEIMYSTLEEAQAALSAQIEALINKTEADRPAADWESLFANRTSPLVLFFCQAVVRMRMSNGQVMPTILKMAKVANPINRVDLIAYGIASYLNEYMQTILRGIPGSVGQAPS